MGDPQIFLQLVIGSGWPGRLEWKRRPTGRVVPDGAGALGGDCRVDDGLNAEPILQLFVVEAAGLDVRASRFPPAKRLAGRPASECLGADDPDSPVHGAGRRVTGRRGFAVPEQGLGAGPAVAGARILAILDRQLAGPDVVEERALGVAMVIARIGVARDGQAIDEGVRPRHARSRDEIMPAVPCEAPLDQHETAVVHVERVAAAERLQALKRTKYFAFE